MKFHIICLCLCFFSLAQGEMVRFSYFYQDPAKELLEFSFKGEGVSQGEYVLESGELKKMLNANKKKWVFCFSVFDSNALKNCFTVSSLKDVNYQIELYGKDSSVLLRTSWDRKSFAELKFEQPASFQKTKFNDIISSLKSSKSVNSSFKVSIRTSLLVKNENWEDIIRLFQVLNECHSSGRPRFCYSVVFLN